MEWETGTQLSGSRESEPPLFWDEFLEGEKNSLLHSKARDNSIFPLTIRVRGL